MCVCVCVCVCSPRSVPCLSHSLNTLVTHTHTYTTALLCSGFTFFIVAFVVFRLKITQPCVFCRSKGLLKCCPYVTHIHTYNTNIQKINCLHIHRYAYLYEHVQIFYLDVFVYHPLNYCIHCYQQDLYMGTCSREWLQRVCLMCVMRFSVCVLSYREIAHTLVVIL